ncbi:MAG: hypothetical protein V4671_12590, partial [Armatimonadota bacterium]
MRNESAQAPPIAPAGHRIDRQALVTRHDVLLTSYDPQEQLQVGNGSFALGIDCTGLQTFGGNTMSDWGWHTNPLPPNTRREDFRLKSYDAQGRKVAYATDATGQNALYTWLRENPHRFNLGRLGLRLFHRDGSAATLGDITEIHQKLALWTGWVTSRFVFDGETVTVETCVHPGSDTVAVRIRSKLLGDKRLAVALDFPAASPGTNGADWTHPERHTTTWAASEERRIDFHRTLDETHYAVSLAWQGKAALTEEKRHAFLLRPAPGQTLLEVSLRFSP